MPRVYPNYPSFTLAMTTSGLSRPDSSRLPSYRPKPVGQFHANPKTSTQRAEELLMRTVDFRDRLEPIAEEGPEVVRYTQRVATCEGSIYEEESVFELDYPIVGDELVFRQVVGEQQGGTRGAPIKTTLDLLATLPRWLSAKIFLKMFHAKKLAK